MSNVYVIAPNYHRAVHWARQLFKSRMDWHYIGQEYNLRGVKSGFLFILDSQEIKWDGPLSAFVTQLENTTDLLIYPVQSESIRQQKARNTQEAIERDRVREAQAKLRKDFGDASN